MSLMDSLVNFFKRIGRLFVRTSLLWLEPLCGEELPRYVTHTNLVLLLKKEVFKNFGDLRPISLSNFFNKIISRPLHGRIVGFLPNIISINRKGFV